MQTAKKKLTLAEEIQQQAIRELALSDEPRVGAVAALSTDAPHALSAAIAPAAETFTSEPAQYASFAKLRSSEAIESSERKDPVQHSAIKLEAFDVNASQRIGRIMDLLKSATEPVTKPHPSPSTDAGSLTSPLKQEPAKRDLSPAYKPALFDEVKLKLEAQQREIDERRKQVDALRSEIAQLEDANKMQADEYKKTLKTRLTAQRREFEGAIKRHLTFIDTLIAEKNELAKKCDGLGEELKVMERGFKEKNNGLLQTQVKLQEEQNLKEIKQQRELWQASEKIKREKWITEKTKIIKDQTVKGLEPEIQRMIAEQTREKLTCERQKACEDEREFARQRYQKQFERDEMEQKRKMQAEFDQMKHYLEQEFRQTRQSDLSEHKKEMDMLRQQHAKELANASDALDKLQRKHAAELQTLREQLQAEKEEWQDRVLAKQDAEIRNWEKQLKEKLIKERDEELELIVQRLESETSSTSGDIHKRYQIQIEKMKTDMMEDTKELREKHNIALDKVIEAQNTIQTLEDQKRELQKQLVQAQHECISKARHRSNEALVSRQKSELGRLQQGEAEIAKTIETEFKEQLERHERAAESWKAKYHDKCSSAYQTEQMMKSALHQALQDKELALSNLEVHIAQALAGKDEQIKLLQQKADELALANVQLKQFIDKQCKELL
ncbi:Centrosomal protein of 131 kDa [Entophlyctis luteolus]|nr:Centrosomal protein of 131 kDa [Entophlyctis luteolus]